MKSLKPLTLLTVLLITVFAFALGAPAVQAQDNPPRTNCDSTTVLLLYLAERYWNFQSTTLDVNQFETGQFTPYFGEIMMGGEAGAGGEMATPEATTEGAATPEATTEGAAAQPTEAATPEATQEGTTAEATTAPSGGEMVNLNPPTISGEDPMCTQLRQEVETFFWNQLQAGTLGDMGSMGADSGSTSTGSNG